MLDELQSIADFIRHAASRFNAAGLCFGHGTDNAVDEALRLVLHALHLDEFCAPGSPLPAELFHARLTRDERTAVAALIDRRVAERVPAAYLIGRVWFAGLPFYVDERVLVPRSPFAELIEAGFAPWVEPAGVRRILEVGTGSGCIAIACAHVFPDAHVDATDVDAGARAVALRNVAEHGVGERVRVLDADVFPTGPDAGVEPYDLILSNPPYVPSERLAALPPEYRAEPVAGLDGGEDGLAVVHRLLAGAGARLAADGALFVEVGESRPALERAYPQLPLVWLDDALEHGGEGLAYLPAAALPDPAAAASGRIA